MEDINRIQTRWEIAMDKRDKYLASLPKCNKCGEPSEENPCGNCLKIAEDARKQKIKDINRLGGERAFNEFTEERFHNKKLLARIKSNPTGSFYLYSPSGYGKSHIATAIIRKHQSGLVVSPQEIYRRVKNFNPDIERAEIKKLAQNKYLVIDDIDTKEGGPAIEKEIYSMLYELLNARWQSYGGCLFITSNLSLAGLTVKFGDDRLASRIKGMCYEIELKDGKDYRCNRFKLKG